MGDSWEWEGSPTGSDSWGSWLEDRVQCPNGSLWVPRHAIWPHQCPGCFPGTSKLHPERQKQIYLTCLFRWHFDFFSRSPTDHVHHAAMFSSASSRINSMSRQKSVSSTAALFPSLGMLSLLGPLRWINRRWKQSLTGPNRQPAVSCNAFWDLPISISDL